jgi:hypothetical protein
MTRLILKERMQFPQCRPLLSSAPTSWCYYGHALIGSATIGLPLQPFLNRKNKLGLIETFTFSIRIASIVDDKLLRFESIS